MIGYCNLRTRGNDSIVLKVQLMGQKDMNSVNLSRYIDDFLLDIQLGRRTTNKGTRFSDGTIASFKQSVNKFKQFQRRKGKLLDFEDIDLKFYREYNSFLIGENYSLNSIGKCIKNLKQIVLCAEEDGLYINPHLYDQQINILIREIGRLAGLNELVEITSTKGGKVTLHRIPKWKLIQTHTARRTGATLMYLSGMDVYDICKITGHSCVKTLERYIKATELETVRKITQEYDYFK